MPNLVSIYYLGRLKRAVGLVDGLPRRPRPARVRVVGDVVVRDVGRRYAVAQHARPSRRHAAVDVVAPSSLSPVASLAPHGGTVAAAAAVDGRRPAGHADRRTSRSDADAGIEAICGQFYKTCFNIRTPDPF